MRRYHRDTDDAVLAQHFRANLTDDQIAFLMKLSVETVMTHRHRLKLLRQDPRTKPREPEPPHITVPTCPIARAKRELAGRITEKNGSYWLDGRCPVSTMSMVREANRICAQNGLPAFGPPAWR